MESSKSFEFCQRPKWTKVLIAWFSVVCLVVFSHITSTISFPTSRDDRIFDPYQQFQAPQNGTVLRLNTRLLRFGWETTLSNPTPLHHFHFGDITPHHPVYLPILTSGCDWKDLVPWGCRWIIRICHSKKTSGFQNGRMDGAVNVEWLDTFLLKRIFPYRVQKEFLIWIPTRIVKFEQ